MQGFTRTTVFLSLALLTAAQVTEYGQCGGQGYTGPTDCDVGLSCNSINTYYSQCLPATKTTPASSETATSNAAATTGSTKTGQYDCNKSGSWDLCDNYWNMYGCNGGSQSTTLYSTSGNTISWSTTYSWSNCGTTPASYTNTEPTVGEGVLLSSVKSIPSSWSWSYESPSSNLAADVSYDLWLGETPDAAASSSGSSFEVMVWLSKRGSIQPIGSLITSSVTVGGYTWNLWGGVNGNFFTYSFVVPGAEVTSFSADLMSFFDYLVDNHGVSASLYVQHCQAGTEPFAGSATLMTTSYSVAINV